MIRRLQRKFVLIAMGSLAAVVLLLIGAVNLANLWQVSGKADATLSLLAENDGLFPEFSPNKRPPPRGEALMGFQLTPETRFETRYFLVRADQSDQIYQIDTGHIAAVGSEEAREYAEDVLKSGQSAGYRGIYRYLVSDTAAGRLVIFLDCRQQLQTATSLLLASVGIAALCLMLVFLLVFILSRRAIRPVIESMEKQKRFITDAGHEIKTPLAIISANADVLELTSGNNEWLDSIRNQTGRLGELVKNLLALSRMEEDKARLTFFDFDLSEAVTSAAAPFHMLAETKGRHFTTQIGQGLRMNGDESGIRQLVSILSDNAVKYTPDGGEALLTLDKKGKQLRLAVENDIDSPISGDLSRLFDRFYREDSSRTRETGGYGIGLSIAKAVAEAHGGHISAKNMEHDGKTRLRFTVVL